MNLDLHGIKHVDVENIVEDFVLLNQYKIPFSIITGNSSTMKEKSINILNRHGFKWVIRSYNLGEIVVVG
jgi:hypothetical protein